MKNLRLIRKIIKGNAEYELYVVKGYEDSFVISAHDGLDFATSSIKADREEVIMLFEIIGDSETPPYTIGDIIRDKVLYNV